MKKNYSFLFFLTTIISSTAQFAPQVGFGSTNAIFKDNSNIKAWATGCTINRGWQNITDKSLGKTSFGSNSDALGPAGGGSTVSLGDSGIAILTFDTPISNGSGADFAVFENAFLYQNAGLAFLELAFVEVSSDGTHFFRFPAISNTQNLSQVNGFDYMDASKIHNLAGKYISNYGTPFDLEELKTVIGLDINNITHVKIIDVIGNIAGAAPSKDGNNNTINDPFPTPFTTSGFDLDAVAVMNQSNTNFESNTYINEKIKIFPTVIKSFNELKIAAPENIKNIKITNPHYNKDENLEHLNISNNYIITNKNIYTNGLYFIKLELEEIVIIKKIIIEN